MVEGVYTMWRKQGIDFRMANADVVRMQKQDLMIKEGCNRALPGSSIDKHWSLGGKLKFF